MFQTKFSRLILAVSLAACSLTTAISAHAATLFPSPPSYPVGDVPYSIAARDLNHDGKLDLVTAGTSGTLSVLLGLGDGSYGARTDYATGGQTFTVAIGDVNGDGNPDLVTVTLAAGGSLSILLGNGDGTFDPYVNPQPGLSLFFASIAIADLNADGKQDLVGVVTDGVSILLGAGDGSFPTHVEYAAPGAHVVTVLDANGDGKLDVATSGLSDVFPSPGPLSIFLGHGDGTLGPRADYPFLSARIPRAGSIQRAPRSTEQFGNELSIAAGDLNGDGRSDVVIAQNERPISVLLAMPDGSFPSHVEYDAPVAVSGLVVADVTGDGTMDLVTADDFACMVSVFAGSGDGAFPTRADYGAPALTTSLATGDSNGDGTPDVLAVGKFPSSVSVLLGGSTGGFAATRDYVCGREPINVVAVDLDGDGKRDVVTANNDQSNVSIFYGKNDGTLETRVDLDAAETLRNVAVGDLNGDGRPDLVTQGDNGNMSVLLNNGGRSFQPKVNYPGLPPGEYENISRYITIGDVNGDGIPDLVGTASFLIGDGDGTFRQAVDYATRNVVRVAVGDLNGDGKLDIVRPGADPGTTSVQLGNGDGTFQPEVQYAGGGGLVTVADLNADGKADIVAGSSQGASVLLGQGDGTFPTHIDYPTGGAPTGDFAVGDVDGDGKADLAVVVDWSRLSVLPGSGNGSFGAPLMFTAGRSSRGVALGDLDRDGNPEAVVINLLSNSVSVFHNTSPARPSLTARVQLDPDVINLGSKGTWVTAYIEPSGFSPSEIDVASVRLFGSLPPASTSGVIADQNRNGAADLAVKFRRADVDPHLALGLNHLELRGSLHTGTLFRGSGDILVRAPQRGPRQASISPNPWNPATSLSFHVDTAGPVRIRLFDQGGRLVRTILDGPAMTAGLHRLPVDGRGAGGASLPSGVYFYRIETSGNPISGRLAIVK